MLSIAHRKIKWAVNRNEPSVKVLNCSDFCASYVSGAQAQLSSSRIEEIPNELADFLLCTSNFY